MPDFHTMDFRLIETRARRTGDAWQVYNTLRQVYTQAKQVQALVQRFATDPAFSDAFDELSWNDGFDGTVFASQMLYQINQLVTAWEGNADYRDLLLLPPVA